MFELFEPLDETTRSALSSYDDLTAALLARRGIRSALEAEAFFSPSYDTHIDDPLHMKDMEKAARRIVTAIESGERIAVWSDYDCDGIPGGVVLHDFFKKIKANFVNYIPHRHEEGFGLNEQGLEKLKAEGASLVITVDCGIADVSGVAYANSIGLEVIITDHHLPGDSLPKAFAIVDPKQEGETYPFRDFCGAGLAWKLVCALLAIGFPGREEVKEGWEKWLLDMAGLATIADMVPLTGENRVIAKYGLLVMRKSPRIGFQKLCKAARVNQRFITEDNIGFILAPRVNAASRMGDPMDAFNLFTTEDEAEADMLAKKLETINRSRRAASGAVTKQVHERIIERLEKGTLPEVIVMGDPDWRPGLLGLVANSIAEEHERPVFLWGREGNNVLKGSCRAGRPDVHLLELMQATADTFVEFGGHRASGGFSVREDAIFFLEEHLNAAYKSLSFKELGDSEQGDTELVLSQISSAFLVHLEKLAPFGMGNPKPVFVLRDIGIEQVSWFGKSGEHLKLQLAPQALSFNAKKLEAVSFYAKRQLGASCEKMESGSHATLLASLERDQFTRGQPVRLRLIAIR